MNVWLVAAGAIAAFLAAFHASGVLRVSAASLGTFRQSIAAIRAIGLSDDERERILRSGSRHLLGAFFSISLRGGASVAVAYLPILVADRLGWAGQREVLSFLARPEIIVGASLILAVAYAAFSRSWRS